MVQTETIEDVYDTINSIKINNEKLENDNKVHENEINNNNKNILESNQKVEEIMKDLIETGGFDKNLTPELKLLNELINSSSDEFSIHKNKMIKCLDLLINFSNKYLDIYKKNNLLEESDSNITKEEKIEELLQLSKEDLSDMCKDYDISHTGSKKKLAGKLVSVLGFD